MYDYVVGWDYVDCRAIVLCDGNSDVGLSVEGWGLSCRRMLLVLNFVVYVVVGVEWLPVVWTSSSGEMSSNWRFSEGQIWPRVSFVGSRLY